MMFTQLKSMMAEYRQNHRETFDKDNLRYSTTFEKDNLKYNTTFDKDILRYCTVQLLTRTT